jgi:hypothetical protein
LTLAKGLDDGCWASQRRQILACGKMSWVVKVCDVIGVESEYLVDGISSGRWTGLLERNAEAGNLFSLDEYVLTVVGMRERYAFHLFVYQTQLTRKGCIRQIN